MYSMVTPVNNTVLCTWHLLRQILSVLTTHTYIVVTVWGDACVN